MVEIGNFIFSLEKYVDAFLDVSQDRTKEALSLSRLERKYQSLQFATPKKLFARQENLGELYSQLSDSFSTLCIGNERSANQVSEEQVSALSEYLLNVCRIRLKLLTFYTMMIEKETLLYCSAKGLRSGLIELQNSFLGSKNLLDSVFSPVTVVIKRELELLVSLLDAQFYISNLHFLNALLCLRSLSKIIKDGIVSSSSSPRTNLSPLFSWLLRFRNTLLAKFSLYWFNILHGVGPSEDLDYCLAKENPDLVLRLRSFTSRPDVSYVSLFFDAQLQDFAYLGHSYVAPVAVGNSPTGVESLPPILTIPPEAHPFPADDVSVIMTKICSVLSLDASEQPRRILSFFDAKIHKTFFLAKIEPRIYLVSVCPKNQLGNAQISSFLNRIGDAMQLIDISRALRPA
uniref:UPF0536 protein C12orf66 n=1 Tax=Schistocephalus solidus TaxID=70667 RepID=A0A0X3PC59_SCHSO